MLLVVLGLVTFSLARARAAPKPFAAAGVALLVAAVLCDSLVPNVQQRLLQDLGRRKDELVFHTNWISALLTALYMVATGELPAALAFLSSRPSLVGLMTLQARPRRRRAAAAVAAAVPPPRAGVSRPQSARRRRAAQGLAGYLGILSYLETVRGYGSKVTTVVTSCRKLFTILLSAFLFSHTLNVSRRRHSAVARGARARARARGARGVRAARRTRGAHAHAPL